MRYNLGKPEVGIRVMREQVSIAMLNDEVTPMEFVVEILQQVFDYDRKTATRIMLDIHRRGGAIVARASPQKGDELVDSVTSRGKKSGHPLTCKIADAKESEEYALKYV
jgi:ATP-dependent Clp protease adaptor protein ClpS|tara:strand:- start:336 stop:662 length:327 start_codon:yes stop_codon:yes gene_type:complete